MTVRALQVLLTTLGLVAIVFGAVTVLSGGALILDAGDVSASVDSELRFYAAWYVGLGVLLLWTVRRVESAGTTIRAVCAVLLLAAAGRVLSIIAVGTPHPLYLTLMAIEFAIPLVIVPWQAVVARRAVGARAGRTYVSCSSCTGNTPSSTMNDTFT